MQLYKLDFHVKISLVIATREGEVFISYANDEEMPHGHWFQNGAVELGFGTIESWSLVPAWAYRVMVIGSSMGL